MPAKFCQVLHSTHNNHFDAAVKKLVGDKKAFIEAVRQALYASKICSYAQGFVQLQEASKEHDWGLNYGDCALLWRGGCIIRAQFLDRIKEALMHSPISKTCCCILTSLKQSKRPKSLGVQWSWQPPTRDCQHQRLAQLWLITTATDWLDCQRICFKHSETTLVLTLTNEPICLGLSTASG